MERYVQLINHLAQQSDERPRSAASMSIQHQTLTSQQAQPVGVVTPSAGSSSASPEAVSWWTRQLAAAYRWTQTRIHPDEQWLCAVGAGTSVWFPFDRRASSASDRSESPQCVRLHHPAFGGESPSVDSTAYPGAILLEHARTGRARHGRLLACSVLCLPITAAMTIVPGPNVFFAYNAYRTYRHFLAWRGCIWIAAVEACSTANSKVSSPSSSTSDRLQWTECDKLSALYATIRTDDGAASELDSHGHKQDDIDPTLGHVWGTVLADVAGKYEVGVGTLERAIKMS